MDRLQAMRIVVKVAETSSFAQTARHMRMSAAAVTRAVAALEETIGTRLFVRTTRSVKLTEAGERYAEDCRRILTDITEAESAAAGSYATPSGELTVTASAIFGRLYVLPVMTEFLDSYPAVSGRTIFIDRTVNLIEEGIDVAVRIGRLADSGYRAIKVGSVRRVLCGSPAYFEAHGVPKSPKDLKRHRIISATGAFASNDWRFAGEERVTVEPKLFCNTNDAAILAAVQGWGLTRILSYQSASFVRDGTLKLVLADYEEAPLPVQVIHPEARHASAKVRAFVDLAVARLRANKLLA